MRRAQAIYADLDTVQHEDDWCRLALRILSTQTRADVPHLHERRVALVQRRQHLRRRQARLRDEAFRLAAPAALGRHAAWWLRAARVLWHGAGGAGR